MMTKNSTAELIFKYLPSRTRIHFQSNSIPTFHLNFQFYGCSRLKVLKMKALLRAPKEV